ncbi:MAG TPA: hypothetical protein VEY71_10525 [Chitinophagales bacterium]|nr:hypothetical protein [Chitinophagales bacterium]
MDANELTARVLFNGQTLMMPRFESDAYRFVAELQQTDARLLVLSFLEDASHQPVHEAVFARMLPRVPEKNASVIYTNQPSIDPNVLQSLANTTHVLLCGVALARTETKLYQSAQVGHVNVLLTEGIERIDADPALKKTMWTAWMKQFGV